MEDQDVSVFDPRFMRHLVKVAAPLTPYQQTQANRGVTPRRIPPAVPAAPLTPYQKTQANRAQSGAASNVSGAGPTKGGWLSNMMQSAAAPISGAASSAASGNVNPPTTRRRGISSATPPKPRAVPNRWGQPRPQTSGSVPNRWTDKPTPGAPLGKPTPATPTPATSSKPAPSRGGMSPANANMSTNAGPVFAPPASSGSSPQSAPNMSSAPKPAFKPSTPAQSSSPANANMSTNAGPVHVPPGSGATPASPAAAPAAATPKKAPRRRSRLSRAKINAIKAEQRRLGVAADGIVGPKTRAARAAFARNSALKSRMDRMAYGHNPAAPVATKFDPRKLRNPYGSSSDGGEEAGVSRRALAAQRR
jgi:hypothetical protein